MVEQFHGCLGYRGITIRFGVAEQRLKERCEDFFASCGQSPRDAISNSRVSSQKLMATFMGQDRLQREVLRVSITFKRLGIDCQQIFLRRLTPPILGTTCLGIDMAVLDVTDETQFPRESTDTPSPGTPFCQG
jgi:hypothetical protein